MNIRPGDLGAAAPSEVAAARALVVVAEQAAAVSEPVVSLAGEELRHVVVHVDAALLGAGGDGGDGQVGELADGQLLARETMRRLACDGHTSVMVDDADGNPLNVGRRQRTLTRRQRRALARRDRGCRFPGCGRHGYPVEEEVVS